MEQGLPWGLCLAAALWLLGGSAWAACPGPAWRVQALAAGVWWVQGEPASGHDESDPVNRGRVANALLVRDGRRLWLLGSGPSPAAGSALGCQARALAGRAVTDVIAPWPRPELVLGQAGLPASRHWAHVEVAQGMQLQCPTCVQRLHQRLGPAASDLGPDPIRLPEGWLVGDQGRLGPFDWWLQWRAPGRPVTVWRLRGRNLLAAHGLLWGDGPPDSRDTRLAPLRASTEALTALDGPGQRWLPEQGPLLATGAPRRHADYWAELQRLAQQGVQRGDGMAGNPPAWPGLPEAWAGHVRHLLNWQHAWREAEDAMFSGPDSTR